MVSGLVAGSAAGIFDVCAGRSIVAVYDRKDGKTAETADQLDRSQVGVYIHDAGHLRRGFLRVVSLIAGNKIFLIPCLLMRLQLFSPLAFANKK